MSASQPNFIFIMVESWDGRVLGCLGDPALKHVTPNIDRLAKAGTLFRLAHATHPICCPVRANLWSGQFTFNCKSWNNHKGLEPGTPILRDVLQEHGGYVFAAGQQAGKDRDDKHRLARFLRGSRGSHGAIGIGKHDYISGGHTQQNRVTAWTGAANIPLPAYTMGSPAIKDRVGKKVHKPDWMRLEMAKRFLNRQAKRQRMDNKREKDDPFFLYLSLTTPHPRFITSRYWLSKVDTDAISIPAQDEDTHPVIEYQRIQKAWKHGLDPDSVRTTRAIYYAMIAETDAIIGQVLDTVGNLGLQENTIVIVMGDHGENNMEHGMYYKMNMYDSSVRVPLVMAGPGIKAGQFIDTPVMTVDLYPTILELAGIPASLAPNSLDGLSLVPLLRGDSEFPRDHAFSMHTGTAANTSMFMLRKGRWKYIAYPGYEPQLFDMEEDPGELRNVASKNLDIVETLDVELRKVCEYDKVHQEWQAYCKQAFREWREKIRERPVPLFEYGVMKPRAHYEDIMANTYKGWTPTHAKQLEQWLDS